MEGFLHLNFIIAVFIILKFCNGLFGFNHIILKALFFVENSGFGLSIFLFSPFFKRAKRAKKLQNFLKVLGLSYCNFQAQENLKLNIKDKNYEIKR